MTPEQEEELLGYLASFKSTTEFLRLIAVAAKWATTIGVFIAVIWAFIFAIRAGVPPSIYH